MSGIFGIWQKDGRPVTPEMLRPMQAIMQLWGQDGVRIGCVGAVGFGRTVWPAASAEQLPIIHPQNKHLSIVADARIDNRNELYGMLNVPAAERAQLTDSVLILLAYTKWGRACVEKLIGAFAFAIWDAEYKTLFCGRDHMGLRPFFYCHSPSSFIFASDLEAILACSSVPQRFNEPLFAAHLQEDTYFAEKRQTFWLDIVKLPPAHHLSITNRASQLHRYWSLDNIRDVRLPSNAAYAERLRELLFEAVDCRIQSEVPIGTHLSGGLDSSPIAAIAAQLLQAREQPLKAYSWSPKPITTKQPSDNEHDFIQAVCRQHGIECRYINLTADDVVQTYQRDFTRVPYEMMLREELVLQQATADGIQIMLSGWGGDECVTGHGWGYLPSLFARGRWSKLHRELLALMNTNNLSKTQLAKLYTRKMLYNVLLPFVPDAIVTRWIGQQSAYPTSWINPQFAAEHRQAVRELRGPSLRERLGVQRMQWRWLDNGHIIKRVESWAVNGARCGIQYHYPMLDRRILEYCLGIPPNQFVQNGWKRSLMRRAVDGLIPPEIQWERSKVELAAFDVIENVMVNGVPTLLNALETNGRVNSAEKYIDLPKLAYSINTHPKFSRDTEVIAITLACANVCKNLS